jgi:hypothetical protein
MKCDAGSDPAPKNGRDQTALGSILIGNKEVGLRIAFVAPYRAKREFCVPNSCLVGEPAKSEIDLEIRMQFAPIGLGFCDA